MRISSQRDRLENERDEKKRDLYIYKYINSERDKDIYKYIN